MTLGTMILGTIVHIIMTHGIMVGLGIGVIPTTLGTRTITGDHITTAAGAGMAEAGIVADIGDMPQYTEDTTEADMLLPTLHAEVDGLLQTMLADVHITDLLLMAQQPMVAEAEISIVEQAD